MAPRSLVEMCLKVATDNISRITGLGSLPPHLVVPILKHVKTANQLRKFELNSDDIYEETAEPWKRIIKQDFPLLVPIHNFVPEDERCWHEVWQRYKDLQDQAEAEAIEALKSQQDLARKQHESRRATIISAKESNKLSRTKHRSGPFQPKANTQHPFLRKTRGDLKLWAKQVGVARTMNGGPLNVLAPGVKRPASSVFPARPDAVDRKRLKTEREAGRPAKNGGTDDVDPEQDDDDDLFGDREFAASLKLTATSPTATSPTATSPTATSPTATSPSSCSINKTASTRRPPPKQTTQPKQPHRAALLVAKAPPNVRVIGRSASPTRLGLKGNWVL